MKSFKRILNEINEPRAGEEWDRYTHSMFGSEPFERKVEISTTPEHVKWLKNKLTHVPWTFGVPADPPVRFERLPVTKVRQSGQHIEVHVNPSSWLRTINRHNVTPLQSQQIPEFADNTEESHYGSSHGEAQQDISRHLFHKINLDNIELHQGIEGVSKPNMVFYLRNDEIQAAHKKHTEDLDPRYDTIEDDDDSIL